MIKLWRENKLASEYTISEEDILQGFYQSSHYRMAVEEGARMSTMLYLYISLDLNSTLVLPHPSYLEEDPSCSLETWDSMVNHAYDHADEVQGA